MPSSNMIIELDEMVAVVDGHVIQLDDIELRGVPCGWRVLRLLAINCNRIAKALTLPDRQVTDRQPPLFKVDNPEIPPKEAQKKPPKIMKNVLGDEAMRVARSVIIAEYRKMPFRTYDSAKDAAETGAWEVCAKCSRYADLPEHEILKIVAQSAGNWARMQRRGKPMVATVPLVDEDQ